MYDIQTYAIEMVTKGFLTKTITGYNSIDYPNYVIFCYFVEIYVSKRGITH